MTRLLRPVIWKLDRVILVVLCYGHLDEVRRRESELAYDGYQLYLDAVTAFIAQVDDRVCEFRAQPPIMNTIFCGGMTGGEARGPESASAWSYVERRLRDFHHYGQPPDSLSLADLGVMLETESCNTEQNVHNALEMIKDLPALPGGRGRIHVIFLCDDNHRCVVEAIAHFLCREAKITGLSWEAKSFARLDDHPRNKRWRQLSRAASYRVWPPLILKRLEAN